jgi:ERCC4-related helicase
LRATNKIKLITTAFFGEQLIVIYILLIYYSKNVIKLCSEIGQKGGLMTPQEFAEQYGLNRIFFEKNLLKARVWVREAQQIADRLEQQSFGVITPTSGGKTVMALLAIEIKPQRTLFLVPLRRLACRHQRLYEALGGTMQTRVVTGETGKSERIFDDHDDRIVFATGDVVASEIKKGRTILEHFKLVVLDEMHNALPVNDPYTHIAREASELGLKRLALSASPGNDPKDVVAIRENCKVDELIFVSVPVSKQTISVLHTEDSAVYQDSPDQNTVEALIKNKLADLAAEINLWQSKLPLGSTFRLDPEKILGFRKITALRRDLIGLPKNWQCLQLWSRFEEYASWTHIYGLVTAESFQALQTYHQEKIDPAISGYRKRMKDSKRLQKIMLMTQTMIHPKLELLGKIMQSMQFREKQVIVFVSNKSTALACYEYLKQNGFSCDVIIGGGKMGRKLQEAVLEKLEDRSIQTIIATTVLREGFNLSLDVIVNMTPPKSAIDMIQRSGRAGRNDEPAEIIYITTKEERPMIYAVQHKIKRLRLDGPEPPFLVGEKRKKVSVRRLRKYRYNRQPCLFKMRP